MNEIIALAVKDLRLLARNRGALFFTLVWPLLIALLFGAIFSGSGDGMGNIRVVLVDEDQTAASRAFADRLASAKGLDTIRAPRDEAVTLVRQGKRQAFVLIARGYGARREQMFYGDTPEVELGIDPSRKAEAAMLEGILMQHAAEDMQSTLGDPAESQRLADRALTDLRQSTSTTPQHRSTERFLVELKSFLGSGATSRGGGGTGMTFQPLSVRSQPVTPQTSGPQNAFAVTLPQGAVWGLVGCAAAFAIGFVAERTRGTLVRVQMAPLTRGGVLAGKAVACFAAALTVQVLVFVVGATVFHVRPNSIGLLTLAVLSACIAFVGIMMLLAVLGRTEQAVSGSTWAALLLMSMIGGGMVPLFAMPRWMLAVSNLSPVKWAILAMEGATWRGFSLAEMALPCGILAAVGVVCFAVGSKAFRTV